MLRVLLLATLVGSSYWSNGQSMKKDQLVGTWIGVHTEWDSTYFCPLAAYLKLGADNTYRLGLVDGSAPERIATWAVQDTTIRLDSLLFKSALIQVQNGLLRVGINYPMVFRRFTDIRLDSAEIHRQLIGRMWQSDSLTIQLFGNGRAIWENRTNNQRTRHFWRLSRLGKSVFLVVMGNANGLEGGYKPLFQLCKLTSQSAAAVGWDGKRVHTIRFRMIRTLQPADSLQPTGFQTCRVCYKLVGSAIHSQQPYDILQAVVRHYQPKKAASESGLVQVRFIINCVGEKGQFSVRGWDSDYRPKTFDNSITGQLTAICRDYIGNKQDSTSESDNRDQSFVLTFRLQNGYITDLL